ncbi:helix-turn-helix domain-containing protein [Sedimentitalea sp. XS_ASV28]|uniref:helix-turn-helix domain-containing protein n=1 Tax=Sedimentitalea sp. XS_ASV28 TaxID=3241296 RepID=UPI00351595AE
MRDQNVTVPDTAAQDCCAQTPWFSDMGSIAGQPWFKPVRRRDLMAAVNKIGRDLGLRPASVLVLDVLLSCLPCKDPKSGKERPISPTMLLTVFASNNTLCFRAKGITERQLRRHLEKLENCGLVHRNDSANGKRFPIHQGGKLIGAFGINLTPLLSQADDIIRRAQHADENAVAMRGLKARISKLRAQCLELSLDDATQAFVENIRNVLRRVATTLAEANTIAQRLAEILKSATPEASPDENQTENLTAADGQNVRHKEPEKTDTHNPCLTTNLDRWHSLSHIREFFPELPRSNHVLQSIAYQLGRMLGITQDSLTRCLAEKGIWPALAIQEQMVRNASDIVDPDGYFQKLSLVHQVGHGQLCRS